MSNLPFNEYTRKMSINYGLERLRLQIEKSFQSPNASIYEFKQIPGMEILEKLTPIDNQKFHFHMAILLFITNIYNFFTVAYFIGFTGFPTGIWLVLEIGFEIILIFDVILRICLRNSNNYRHMWFFYQEFSVVSGLCFLASSIPYSLLCLAYSGDLNHWGIALVRLPKLLRGTQLSTFFTNMKIIQRNKNWLVIDFFKLLLFALIITHFLGMFYLLLVRLEESNSHEQYYIHYWENKGYDDLDILIDIEFWSLGALESITISSIVPLSNLQRAACVLYIVIGNTIFGAIFSAIIYKINQQNKENLESKKKFEVAKTWTEKRKIPEDLKQRVLFFFKIAEENFAEMLKLEVLDHLPFSLRTEISMFIYKDLIPKVKLFQLGEPEFIMSIVRNLKPKLFMAEDFIVRQGDYAEEFFIISFGNVEVLTANDLTTICLLEEGGYFGEIGILLNMCRTVSIRANIATLVASLSKKHFLKVLNNFPEHQEYLTKIAKQRLQTINSADIDLDFDLLEDNIDLGSFSSEESDCEYYAPAEYKSKSWIGKLISVPESKSIVGKWKIDPFSHFYYIWSSLLALSYTFYLYYIPFIFAFNSKGSWVFLFLDILSYIIFIIDIWVTLHSSIFTKFGDFIQDNSEIKKKYFNKYFLLDILSIIPSDYFSELFNLPLLVVSICKCLRLFKFRRLKEIFYQIKMISGFSATTLRVSTFVPMIFYVSHLTACVFIVICKYQRDYYEYIGSNKASFLSKYDDEHDVRFLDMDISTQYIEIWYFTSSIYSSNTYNLVIPVSLLEKLYCFFLLILIRLIIATLLAEAATLKGFENSMSIDQKAKMAIYLEWISQNNLPLSLKSRIINHNKLMWFKLKGCEDSEVLKFLPESLKVDINSFLFESLIKSGFFPSNNEGAIRLIIKKCKICLCCTGESIITEGELGMEMFFILDGEVEVKSLEKTFTILGKGNIFGEMALLNINPCQRNASVLALNDVTLAVLSLEDFQEVARIYPDFCKSLYTEAAIREQTNRKNAFNTSLIAQNKLNKNDESNDERINHTELRENFKNPIDIAIELPIKATLFVSFLKFYKSNYSFILHVVVCSANVIIIPLIIAFHIQKEFEIIFEVFSCMVFLFYSFYFFYILHCLQTLPEQLAGQIFPDLKKMKIQLKAIHNLILCLPVLFIFSFPDSELIELMYCVIRLTCYYYILELFEILKDNLEWFHIIKFFEVILHFMLTSHILACLFIEIASWDDHNWMNTTVGPDGSNIDDSYISIYIHGTYWAFTCLSHASLGNIVAVSNNEKLFNSFVCLFGCIFYSLLFGNICSLVYGFNSILRKHLYNSFIFISDFIKKKRAESVFSRHISDFQSFLWRANKIIVDRKILEELPMNLRIDIQMFRYKNALFKSPFFKDADMNVNFEVIKALLRFMEIQFYLPGDCIVKIDDKNCDLFLVMNGEVDAIELNGDRVLGSFSNGDYFGECRVLLGTEIGPFCVIATCISEIAVINEEKFKKIIAAYPDWAENLTLLVEKNICELLSCDNRDDVCGYLEDFKQSLIICQDLKKIYTIKAEKLITEKLVSKQQSQNKHEWLWLNFIHTSLIIYSVFAIPIELALDYPVDGYLLLIEFFILLESFFFFLVTCKLTLLLKTRPNHEHKEILKLFYKNYAIHDIIACSPFNVIFPFFNISEPTILIYTLRSIRLLSVIRLPSLIHKIELYYKEFINLITILKSLFFLSLLMHWFSCFWYLIVKSQSSSYTWLTAQNLTQSSESSTKWVNSMYFVMNVVTGTGFTDSIPLTITEILLTMLYILTGNMLFAAAFGLLSTLSYIIKSKIDNLLEKSNFILKTVKKFGLSSTNSPSIISRLEAFYAFDESIINFYGSLDFKVLSNYLPKNLVHKIACECNKHILRKMKIFENQEFEELADRISLIMLPKIYLPGDYIIRFNDVGEEMYFIVLGDIDIFSANGKIVRRMFKGEYFGELSLIFGSRRTMSAVSKTLSMLYLLKRKYFDRVIKDYPKALERIITESRIRNQGRNINENVKGGDWVDDGNKLKIMKVYSNNSNIFSGLLKNKHLTLIGSIDRFKEDLDNERSNNEKEEARLYKRRPGVFNGDDRRHSQESLGKELMLSNFSKLKMKWIVEDNA